MSSEARAPAGAMTSRSGIPPAVVSVRAVPEGVDHATVLTGIPTAPRPNGHLEAAAVADGRSGGQAVSGSIGRATGRSRGIHGPPDRLPVRPAARLPACPPDRPSLTQAETLPSGTDW